MNRLLCLDVSDSETYATPAARGPAVSPPKRTSTRMLVAMSNRFMVRNESLTNDEAGKDGYPVGRPQAYPSELGQLHLRAEPSATPESTEPTPAEMRQTAVETPC